MFLFIVEGNVWPVLGDEKSVLVDSQRTQTGWPAEAADGRKCVRKYLLSGQKISFFHSLEN